jgi:hypothetical protein
MKDSQLLSQLPWPAVPANSKMSLLFLQNNPGLGGSLPSELWHLPLLAQMDISNTGITGPIPNNIASGCVIQKFQANNAPLGGSLPFNLGICTILDTMLLRNTSLTGEWPSSSMNVPKLRYFDLSANELEGPLPEDWSGFPKMANIDLSNNHFTGTVPVSMLQASNATLTRFILASNGLDLCGNSELNSYSVRSSAVTCNVGSQTPAPCGCSDIWETCLTEPMPGCPSPLEPTTQPAYEPTSVPEVAHEPSSDPVSGPIAAPAGAPSPSPPFSSSEVPNGASASLCTPSPAILTFIVVIAFLFVSTSLNPVQ